MPYINGPIEIIGITDTNITMYRTAALENICLSYLRYRRDVRPRVHQGQKIGPALFEVLKHGFTQIRLSDADDKKLIRGRRIVSRISKQEMGHFFQITLISIPREKSLKYIIISKSWRGANHVIQQPVAFTGCTAVADNDHLRHQRPPESKIFCPVSQRALSDNRKAARCATSSGIPSPKG